MIHSFRYFFNGAESFYYVTLSRCHVFMFESYALLIDIVRRCVWLFVTTNDFTITVIFLLFHTTHHLFCVRMMALHNFTHRTVHFSGMPSWQCSKCQADKKKSCQRCWYLIWLGLCLILNCIVQSKLDGKDFILNL